MLANAALALAPTEFARDVRLGLLGPGQKHLPSKYLYDNLGSKLFDAICELPQYGLTRADERILIERSSEIAAQFSGDLTVCELGSGTGRKTRSILESLANRCSVRYYAIELSAVALEECRRQLSSISSVQVVGIERDYLAGLGEVSHRRVPGDRLLVLFLGSTIGNFTPPADLTFLQSIRSNFQPGDSFLLGTDLLKPVSQMIEAYDDPLGVTAAFNLNLLVRMNRELSAAFPLELFRHEARFNTSTSSIEMHLKSIAAQTVRVRAANFTAHFEPGETIWTETSHKYSLDEIRHLTRAAGFARTAQWVDEEWPFAETLLTAI